MDWYVTFPVSGVRTSLFLPPIVAFAVSLVASMGGVSGAFLLLPFQLSFLHFVSPSVSATNFVYNIVAIPSGVYRYIRERRMVWPLAWAIILGTLPGVLLGYYLRVWYLPNPGAFRLFVGCVLLYVGARLLREVRGGFRWTGIQNKAEQKVRPFSGNPQRDAIVKTVLCSMKRVEYEFRGERFSFGVPRILLLAFIVGTVGGAYGIGGGSIIAPFCVTFFLLPVYTVAGAALLGTFLTSIAGVIFYSVIPAKTGISTYPDWQLGILFGLGGILGMYCGARLQKFVPQNLIKTILGMVLLLTAGFYIIEFFVR
jgi:hypothetical protein